MSASEKIVLVTDYAWPSLAPETEILGTVGARLLVAESGNEEELMALAPQADAILFNWARVSARVLQNAMRCVCAGRYGIGVDNIDLHDATALGIIVTNVPAYCVDDVADHTLALLLACARKLCSYDRDLKAGRYALQEHTPLHRLRGRTLGLVGFGKIGRAVAHRASAFGLRILALNPRSSDPEMIGPVEFVSFPELIEGSDYISLHVPATAETTAMFREETFQRMKRGVVLINTARGSLLPAALLLPALDSGRVAMAGLDVWPHEPVPANDALSMHPRVVATPHAAFYSTESIFELQKTAASQVAAVLKGSMPRNIVNPEVLQVSHLRARLISS